MKNERLKQLVDKMKDLKIDAYVVPSTDPHQSEYVPNHWQRRSFISGFTGSAGDLVITEHKAGLWTDSRYFIQAEAQLKGTGIELFRLGIPSTPSIPRWLCNQLEAQDAVGVDSRLFSVKQYEKYQSILEKSGISLRSLEHNPIDSIWTNRPPLSSAPVQAHPLKFSGQSIAKKLSTLRREMDGIGASVHLVTTLDAIAWLFNIRGSDVPFNPVVIANAAIEQHSAHLFVDDSKIDDHLRKHLGDQVQCHPYDDFGVYLNSIDVADKVLLDPDTTSQWTISKLPSPVKIVKKQSPIVLMKAKKNEVELAGMEAAHQRDGAAMVRFLSWLENQTEQTPITEIRAAEKLAEIRSNGEHFVGLSFGTISAFGPNGAIVHYEPDQTSNAEIKKDNLYLVDSGGQYLDGTTDITRTICLGEPTAEQRLCFTKVLKGHLNLAATPFPYGTSGNQLDTIARKPLWELGLNYGHGTGHGVGAYLNVHEGPQAISYYRGMGIPLEEGMILSIEPGCYKEGKWGIRIENLVKVVIDDQRSFNDVTFLKFVSLTLCPIDRKLIDTALLTESELNQLDRYHKTVYEKLSPLLSSETGKWLRAATAPFCQK